MSRIVIAPDKFKGSLSAADAAVALALGVRDVLPDAEVVLLPLADGGEGTVAAALGAGYAPHTVLVSDALGRPVEATFAARGRDAVVEVASAAGLAAIELVERRPLEASTFGVGQVVAAALDRDVRRVVLGVGGTASTDAGTGMLTALGANVADDPVDFGGLDSRLAEVNVVVAVDVDSGLLDAATVYAAQKGASAKDVAVLEARLGRWRTLLGARHDVPGAGAGGGLAFGAMAGLGASLTSGAEFVLDLIGFDTAVHGAALVITAEGSLDDQTLRGKAPAAVAKAAARRGVPVVALAGQASVDAAALGVRAVHQLLDLEPDAGRCMAEAPTLLRRLGAEVALAFIDGS